MLNKFQHLLFPLARTQPWPFPETRSELLPSGSLAPERPAPWPLRFGELLLRLTLEESWSRRKMPHFTIEYSGNLDRSIDMGAIVELVRKAAVEAGIFPLGGIRVRAIRCEHYAIADGRPDYAFLDMVLRLGEGRDLTTRKKAGEHIFKALSAYLDPVFAKEKFALSFNTGGFLRRIS